MRAKEFTQGVAESSGFEQEAGIGIDGKSFKFKIKDLVAFANRYPVTKVNPKEFIQQIKGRDEDPTQSMARAEKADLQYPIIVIQRKNGQLWIADGTHRAHKAILNKLPTINAKIIPIDDMESFEIKKVDEAPLPPDWDPEKLNLRQTYKDRLKYALDRAKRLGGGSSRVALTIEHEGRPTVLKVAKNAKGLAQNEAEVEILLDGYSGNLPIVIPLIDYDKANKRPVWLQTELARKVRSDTLAKLLHTLHLWDLIDCAEIILGNTKKYRKVNTIQEMKTLYFNENWPKNNPPTEKGWEIFLGYAHELADLASSTTIEIWDLNNASNWGIYNNRPVVLDLGFTEDTAELYGFTKK